MTFLDPREQFNDLMNQWKKVHGATVFRTILASVRQEHDAEEVEQEFWIKILRHLRAQKPMPKSPKAWLRRVAANVAIDFLRRRPVEVLYRRPFDESVARLAVGDPNSDRSQAATDQMIEALLDAIESLDPSLRRVVEGSLNGLTIKEVADRLGVHRNTVAKRRGRLLKRLYRQLQARCQELEDLGVEFLPQPASVKAKNRSS